MSVWKQAIIEKPIEDIVAYIETLGSDYITKKITEQNCTWYFDDKTTKKELWKHSEAISKEYRAWYIIDENDFEDSKDIHTCIQTQKHVDNHLLMVLLKHFGGLYVDNDCSGEYEKIEKCEV